MTTTPKASALLEPAIGAHIDPPKRLNVRQILTAYCPECGRKHRKDLSGPDHLYCFPFNTDHYVPFCCENDDCYHEWRVGVRLNVCLDFTHA